MRYLAMLFLEDLSDSLVRGEHHDLEAQYARFKREASEAGVFVSSETLKSSDSATVVRALESGASVSDGPYFESPPTLSAVYLLDCDNLDQAIEWAAQIPSASHGAVEVRPVVQPLENGNN